MVQVNTVASGWVEKSPQDSRGQLQAAPFSQVHNVEGVECSPEKHELPTLPEDKAK